MIQALGNQIIEIPENTKPNNIQEWPDLMPTLMRVIVDQTKDGGTRADCVWVVKELIITIWPVMIANTNQTLQVLTMCFQDTNGAVSGTGLALYLELLENVSTKHE